MVVEMALVLGGRYFGLGDVPRRRRCRPGYSNTKELGRLLYTDYVYPFEIAAVILLVAIVAAIALTLRRRKDTKYQDPAQQVARASARTACDHCRCRARSRSADEPAAPMARGGQSDDRRCRTT